ncbi:MAG: tRNA threonylcarbamoyladenosine dehydratase, partial [Ruminococcaceae bacterium]|nr:tRNA threonylcarbamoyladenosine dehydratase [Oscillospiraceae bacterium]
LKAAHVAVFGIGGVGGHIAEALARSGVGELTLVDSDVVSESNINRQIVATYDTLGKYKTEAAAERILSVNPECIVHERREFYLPENSHTFDFTKFTYVADAIDTVSGKISLITEAKAAGVPVISAMGAGNKLDPTAFEVTDIYKTSVCPLAAVMRRELRKRGVDSLKCVYSKEPALRPRVETDENGERKKIPPGSTAFVPGVSGLIIAGEIIKDIAAGKCCKSDGR